MQLYNMRERGPSEHLVCLTLAQLQIRALLPLACGGDCKTHRLLWLCFRALKRSSSSLRCDRARFVRLSYSSRSPGDWHPLSTRIDSPRRRLRD